MKNLTFPRLTLVTKLMSSSARSIIVIHKGHLLITEKGEFCEHQFFVLMKLGLTCHLGLDSILLNGA
jgi:hypothetical protein